MYVLSVLTGLPTYHMNNASHTNNFQQPIIDAWFLKAVITLRPPEIGSGPPAAWRAHHSDHPWTCCLPQSTLPSTLLRVAGLPDFKS